MDVASRVFEDFSRRNDSSRYDRKARAMFKSCFKMRFASLLIVGLLLGVQGCNWFQPGQDSRASEEQQQRDEKTRDEVAKATERLKPAIESAGRKLDEATQKAAEEARAAAQGVQEGCARGAHPPLDLYSDS